ncbi:MAG: MTH1187 family thiamine-binding protein [Candidatus Aureabacteria bacterium]|nr:MTH1187 family thiamine-binding protein [Candidatus Auribacterota bacterium]
MPIMEINVIPLGTQTPSVSHYIARSIKILKNEDVKYSITSMGTIIESDSVKTLLNIAFKMHSAVLNQGVNRVVTSIRIDDRKDKAVSMKSKIASVGKKLK